jgi:hypothetical protein
MALPLTEMLCFHVSDTPCRNDAPISAPVAQHAFSFAGDFILSAQGTFTWSARTGGRNAIQLTVGWITGGGPDGNGPGYGVTVYAEDALTGANFMTGTFGPLATPMGTQVHIEIGFDTQTGLCNAKENGAAMIRHSFFPGSPAFNVATLTALVLSYGAAVGAGDACVGNVGLYVGTTTPTGTPYVHLTIPPGGVATDFLANSGGVAGPFTKASTAHLCSACDVTPPPEPLKLAMDDVNCTTIPALERNLVFVEWSDDRGHSWGNPVGQPMGEAGEYRTSLQWQRLGMGRDRVFRIFWSVPTNTALQGCWLDSKPASS